MKLVVIKSLLFLLSFLNIYQYSFSAAVVSCKGDVTTEWAERNLAPIESVVDWPISNEDLIRPKTYSEFNRYLCDHQKELEEK